MRILWGKPGKLLPLDTGGKLRSYNLLRHLAARNEVVFVSWYAGPRDEAYEREIGEHLPGAVAAHVRGVSRESSAAAQVADYLRRLPSSAPYAVAKHADAGVRARITRWLDEGRFDVAVCDFLAASLTVPPSARTPVVLFQHNVESALWERQARHERHRLKRLAFRLEAAKMLRYERRAVASYPHVIAVSEHDRALMAEMTDPARISVAPTGVDVSRFRPLVGREATAPVVLFLGSMDWEANVDAVDYFCRDVWPLVRAEVPEAHFRIVGRNPHPKVWRLASDSVTVTGTVPSVLDHLAEAAVVVVPLRIGGGTRLKIFEAMGAGRAVVSTAVGAEGLAVEHGRNILLADEPRAFADAVSLVLRDPARRRQLEAGAAALAARYDWTVITEQFEEILASVAAGTAPAAAGARA